MSKKILAEVFSEIDAVIAKGKIDLLDHIDRCFWVPGAPLRQAGEAWIASADTAELQDFATLYVKLQEYSLVPGVSRRVERLHAHLKRQGSYAFGIQLPYLCALCRTPGHLEKVRKEPEFCAFCLERWRSRNLPDLLLKLRVDADVLKRMSVGAKKI